MMMIIMMTLQLGGHLELPFQMTALCTQISPSAVNFSLHLALLLKPGQGHHLHADRQGGQGGQSWQDRSEASRCRQNAWAWKARKLMLFHVCPKPHATLSTCALVLQNSARYQVSPTAFMYENQQLSALQSANGENFPVEGGEGALGAPFGDSWRCE